MSQADLRCGELALKHLQKGSGEVIAAFKSSAYLANAAGKLLALGTSGMPAGPLNISINAEDLPLASGARWRYRDRLLTIGNTRIADLSQYRIWHPPTAVAVDIGHLQAGLSRLQQALPELAREPTLDAINAVLERGCASLTSWLQQPRHLPPALIEMIGCGEGLTPAGDDILCGFIVALHSLTHPTAAEASKALSPVLAHRTNHISAAHLQAACEGVATELLHNLIKAVSTNDRAATADSVAAMKRYGHSSGYHAVRGVVEALSCLTRIESQTRSRSQTD